MKKTNKKGFTIVELVIVIAVIAILAAVLVPNISRLVKKANESSDLSLVRNLNTALAVENTTYATAYEAFEAVKEAGYDLTKIEAKASDNKILFDSANQCFAYLDGSDLKYYPNSTKSDTKTPDHQLWAIVTDKDEAEKSTYSVYWNGEADDITVKGVGFDAGEKTVKSVTYTGASEAHTVTIRTNGGVLTVDAGNDSVNHYDTVDSVMITAVASKSYHEFGTVKGDIVITKGHVVLEKTANVGTIKIADAAEANKVKLSNNSTASVVLVDKDSKISTDSNIGASSVKVTDDEAVALIGETSYKTIDSALLAAKDGDTIKLIADYRLPENTPDTRIARLEINKKITLDFGNYHIIGLANMGNNEYNFSVLFVSADTTFVAENDGGIICEENGAYAVNVMNGAKLTIKSGTYYGGGTAVQVQKGEAEILGGIFEVEPYSNPTYGYRFTINCIDAAFKDGSAKITIKGGSFYKFDPANSKSENPYGEFTASGYIVNATDEWYTVVPKK